jgi:flagellin
VVISTFSNIASLSAQRRLNRSTDAVASISESLSSGQRITSASSDAAGLAVSSSLNLNARVYSQAIRNINDGVSLLNIAEGALQELSSITMRQQELAEQASNGVYSSVQRQALHNEVYALVNEQNRIIASTKFNGLGLFDGTLKEGLLFRLEYDILRVLVMELLKKQRSRSLLAYSPLIS